MPSPETTCWTLIHGAAAGQEAERSEFARRYEGVVTAYLRARWNGTRWSQETGDAVQEFFVECFKPGGVLEAVEQRASGFRAFLYGAAKNVACRIETRSARRKDRSPENSQVFDAVAADEPTLSRVFDKAWALSLVREAQQLVRQQAESKGERAMRRFELLRLRFAEGKPIRDIAKDWEVPAQELHDDYAQARQEFKRALLEVVNFHGAASQKEASHEDALRECREVLSLLGKG